jgi:hypothetical protein
MITPFSVATLLTLAAFGAAITPIPSIYPFSVEGALDTCTVDVTSEYNSGGFVTVNGWNIKVPKNLIAQFPAAWVPFPEMCAGGVAGKGYEVLVAGNVVNGQAIAAQIQIAQFLVEFNEGYIESVNIADGSMKLVSGPTIRINDPDAVYSKGFTGASLFAADAENPTISSFSGFPMCIPRSANDPLCPSSNRPAGSATFQAPNPLVMAPFLAGDYIQFSGIKDPATGEIWAYNIVAVNVEITTTASATVPNYIRIEVVLVEVNTGEARFVGFLSSCAGAAVTISAIEVDPCTGEETFRDVGTATPRPGDPSCKFDFRPTIPSPYTREYRFSANSAVVETQNGIKAGQYIAGVNEWIQVEAGGGTEPAPYEYQNIVGLVQGDFLNDKQFGVLSPFPGLAPPPPAQTCTGTPPPANAEPVASAAPLTADVRVGAQVLLRGSNTASGLTNNDLDFVWTKTTPANPTISIQNAASPTATFVAPSVTARTTFTFQVSVSLKSDATKSSTATVTVVVDPTAPDQVFVDIYTWESRQSGSLSVNCHSDVVSGANTGMTLRLSGTTNINMLPANGPGKWAYTARSTNRPTSVQCISNLGGQSAVVTATTSRRVRRGELGAGGEEMSRAEWL